MNENNITVIEDDNNTDTLPNNLIYSNLTLTELNLSFNAKNVSNDLIERAIDIFVEIEDEEHLIGNTTISCSADTNDLYEVLLNRDLLTGLNLLDQDLIKSDAIIYLFDNMTKTTELVLLTINNEVVEDIINRVDLKEDLNINVNDVNTFSIKKTPIKNSSINIKYLSMVDKIFKTLIVALFILIPLLINSILGFEEIDDYISLSFYVLGSYIIIHMALTSSYNFDDIFNYESIKLNPIYKLPILNSVEVSYLNEELLIEDESLSTEKEIESNNEESITNETPIVEQVDIINNVNTKIIRSKTIFSETYPDLNDYIEQLTKYYSLNNYTIQQRTLRRFLSGLASTKLVTLNNEDNSISLDFLNTFTEFIGANLFINTIDNSNTNLNSLLNEESGLLQDAIDTSFSNPDVINFFVLNNVDLNTVEVNFKEIIKYSLNPKLDINISSAVSFPENLWFILNPKSIIIDNPNSNLYFSSILINTPITKNKEISNDKNNLKITNLSYLNFRDILFEEIDNYALKESSWKKFDEIEHYFKVRNFEIFDNRFVRQLENFLLIYFISKGQLEDALDDLISSKIIPLIINRKLQDIEDDNNGYFELLENLFGLENLTNTRYLINQYNKNN